MAIEQSWLAVPPQLFTADGGEQGQIKLANTSGFKVKMLVVIQNSTGTQITAQIKRVNKLSIIVGPKPGDPETQQGKAGLRTTIDLSQFTLANVSFVYAVEQVKARLKPDDVIAAVYEQEPTVAIRTVAVDEFGDKFSTSNPAPSSTYFNRNGASQEVTEDTTDPSKNRPLPVKITGMDGDVIINSENLNLETQSDGVYDGSTNIDPDSIGMIGHERSLATDRTKQTQRVTAKRGTVDTDTVSQDVSLHDPDGNAYNSKNPVPTSSAYEKFFTLISHSNWMKLANYDGVVPSFVGDDLTLAYKEDGVIIGEAVISNYVSQTSWNLTLNRYINDDDGTMLLDDDGTPLNLD